MATLEDVVTRLDHMSDSLDKVATTQHLMANILSGHKERLNAQQDHMTQLQEQTAQHQERMNLLQEQATQHQERMNLLQEQTKQHQERMNTQQDHMILLQEQNRQQREEIKLHRDELTLHREELKEMHRFNQQTRRMWILIARNMEWLAEDEDFD